MEIVMNSQTRANDSDAVSWADRSPSDIVAFILSRFHEPLHRGLPALVASARSVESAADADALCPHGLGDHLEQVRLAVEAHLAKEEQILFPLILAGSGRATFMPIKVMMAEHADHAANLARTHELTHDFQLPGDAAPAWRSLYLELERFETELRQHIALEDNVLFTRVLGADGP
jgi:regulator of cell morphogenesis and NO signaling